MTSLAEAAHTLTALARSKSGAGRERLLAALCTLGETSGAFARPEVQELLTDLLTAMLAQAGPEERAGLTERLGHAPWAPRSVLHALPGEPSEDARAVLASSPALSGDDLVQAAREGEVEEAIAVASRPRPPAEVVAALVERGRPSLLAALASNAESELGPDALARLVEAAATSPALRAALAGRCDLTPELAAQLHRSSGGPLRASLEARFPSLAGLAPEPRPEGLEAAQRLVDKLHAAGQLGPGRLLRFLREGRLDLFQLGLAVLSGKSLKKVRAACADPDQQALAKACKRAGLDRAVLPEVMAHLARLPARAHAGLG